jgi:hypothetical protein
MNYNEDSLRFKKIPNILPFNKPIKYLETLKKKKKKKKKISKQQLIL